MWIVQRHRGIKPFRHPARVVFALLLLAACVVRGAEPAATGEALPNIAWLLLKVLARAKWVEEQGRKGQYCFNDVKVTEELDDDGSVKKSKEQVFHVTPVDGMLYPRMIKSGGKPLTEKETKAEDEMEKKFRARLANPKTATEEKRRSLRVSKELLDRFDFSLVGRKVLDGRPAYEIRFKPKSSNAPEKDLFDRFMNRVAGRIWVDAEDFEMARLDIELQESVDVWSGLIGSLKKLALTIERRRLADGFWVQARSAGEIQSRKLFSTSRIRYRVETKDYERLEKLKTAAP